MEYIEREKQKFQEYVNSVEYSEKLQTRLKITASTQSSKEKKLYAYHLCKNDPIFFIENFGWTYDPRPEHQIKGANGNLPFILFDYQKEFILYLVAHIKEGKDLYIDKSRDMGATWCLIWVYLWFWLFADTFSGHLGSRKEDLVDNKTRDSLFGILDYGIRSLPKWILPERFSLRKHRFHLKLINPANFNLVTGESMNQDFSRQSRKSCVAFDEFAFWDYGKDAWDSSGDTTPCRIALTTPNGRNHAALLRESGIDVTSLHWKKNPLKDSFWYEFQKSRRTEEEIAQELDISYQKSQEGRVYPEWDLVEYGLFPYDEELPLYVSWDFGQTDDTAMIWWQKEPVGRWHIVDCYWNRGKTIDFYIPFITGIVPSEGYKYTGKDLVFIEEHKNWKKGTHFGDPAGRFTNQVTNQSVMDILKNNGIHINFREEAKDFQTRKIASKMIMRNLVVNKNERNDYLGICMSNSAYPRVRDRGSEMTKSIKPKHDSFSHLRSSFEYGAVNFDRLEGRSRKVIDQFKPKSLGKFGSGRLIGY